MNALPKGLLPFAVFVSAFKAADLKQLVSVRIRVAVHIRQRSKVF